MSCHVVLRSGLLSLQSANPRSPLFEDEWVGDDTTAWSRLDLSDSGNVLLGLTIDSSGLAKIPAEFCQSFPELKALWLSNNGIRKLPSEIGLLTSLETLSLGQNLLSALPENVSSLKHLKRLELPSNLLKAVPIFLSSLHELEWL
jgi:hypothetical protein